MDSITKISKEHHQAEDKIFMNDGLSNNSRSNQREDSIEAGSRNLPDSLAKKIRTRSREMLRCFDCKTNEVASKTYKCFSCKIDKCRKCAEKDLINTQQKMKSSSYICENCFQSHLKLRKKTGHDSGNQDLDTILHKKRRRKKNTRKQNETTMEKVPAGQGKVDKIDENENANTTTLDVDKLHEIVNPEYLDDFLTVEIQLSSKLREQVIQEPEGRKQKSKPDEREDPIFNEQSGQELPIEGAVSPQAGDVNVGTCAGPELRKSLRMRNKIQKIEENAINCHQCKKIEATKNIITCSNEFCRDSYCFSCLQQYSETENRFERLKSPGDCKVWICYKCKGECLCNSCKEARGVFTKQRRRARLLKETYPKPSQLNRNDPTAIPKGNIPLPHKRRRHRKPRWNVMRMDLKKSSQSKQDQIQKKVTTNIITIPMSENNIIDSQTNKIVEVDNFIIYENESQEESKACEDNMEENHIEELEDSFNEYDYNLMNDKKISTKLLQACHAVEDFFPRKYKETLLKRRCVLCQHDIFHSNDLLRFKNSDDFLNYLMYSLIYKKNILKNEKKIFEENKSNILNFVTKYFSNENTNEWDFKETKTVCKFCFMNSLNSEKCMEKFKKSLVDLPKQDMNITIINNFNTPSVSMPKNQVIHTNHPEKIYHISKTLAPRNRGKINHPPEKLFHPGPQKDIQGAGGIRKEKVIPKETIDELQFASTFNDKPAGTSQGRGGFDPTSNLKFPIPQFFASKGFVLTNIAVARSINDLQTVVSTMNQEIKEAFPNYYLINYQLIIQEKIEEIHKNILKLFQYIYIHKEQLNKILTFLVFLSERRELSSIPGLSGEIQEMQNTLAKWIEVNNFYVSKYDELAKKVALWCSHLLIQITEQTQFMAKLNTLYENIMMQMIGTYTDERSNANLMGNKPQQIQDITNNTARDENNPVRDTQDDY